MTRHRPKCRSDRPDNCSQAPVASWWPGLLHASTQQWSSTGASRVFRGREEVINGFLDSPAPRIWSFPGLMDLRFGLVEAVNDLRSAGLVRRSCPGAIGILIGRRVVGNGPAWANRRKRPDWHRLLAARRRGRRAADCSHPMTTTDRRWRTVADTTRFLLPRLAHLGSCILTARRHCRRRRQRFRPPFCVVSPADG